MGINKKGKDVSRCERWAQWKLVRGASRVVLKVLKVLVDRFGVTSGYRVIGVSSQDPSTGRVVEDRADQWDYGILLGTLQ